MTHRKRAQTPEYQWEQALLEAYHDYRWREILEPLYQKFQRLMCARCMNFACPFNAVDQATRASFFACNPVVSLGLVDLVADSRADRHPGHRFNADRRARRG